MEEVHASNSLSSSKLAAPAQKDLGAVNNSVWLRDFHFAGPGLPIPQGLVRGWLPAPFRSAPPLASQLLSAALARSSMHAPPCTASPPAQYAQPCPPCFTFSCSLPASFFSISLFFVCRLPPFPPPVPPMQHIKRISLSASLIHWLPSATAEAELLCCLLSLFGLDGRRTLPGRVSACSAMAATGCWS